jgi:hypothetical protein
MRRALIYTHRWLGIGGCLLFLVWFASGIVMMYARMPELATSDRLARLRPITSDAVRISPADAVRVSGIAPSAIRLSTLEGRPVYRLSAALEVISVFADDGERLDGISRERAVAIANQFAGDASMRARYDAFVEQPDQWTLTGVPRTAFPLHRVDLHDADATVLYVSDATGDPVMRTTARGRRWGYAGAVLHWLYFAPFRRHPTLWAQSIIWLSIAGTLMCATGLVWGVWRYSPSARYRLKREHAHSPYAGMMHWHHYAGLFFGLTTGTWIFSGLLSMDPWDWHPGTTPTRDQRDAVAGGSVALEAATIPRLRAAIDALASRSPRDIEIVQFRGEAYLVAEGHKGIVSLAEPGRGAATRLPDEAVRAAATAAMPHTPIVDEVWLHGYDAYYYDRDGSLPLPILRVRYDDPRQTWLYFDPHRGAIVRKEERWSRVNRWLYHGLHSFDFPVFYYRRPLWDVLVIALSVGGIVSTVTAVTPAFRRLRRHARRGWLNARRRGAEA